MPCQAQAARKLTDAQNLVTKAGQDPKVKKMIGKKPAGRGGRGRGRGRGRGEVGAETSETSVPAEPRGEDMPEPPSEPKDSNTGEPKEDEPKEDGDDDNAMLSCWTATDPWPEGICFDLFLICYYIYITTSAMVNSLAKQPHDNYSIVIYQLIWEFVFLSRFA